MANYTVTDTELSSIANAIRTKGGTSASLAFPSGFVSAINDISGGGSEFEQLCEGTLSVIENSTARFVASRAFIQKTTLEKVWFSNASFVAQDAFYGCISINDISFPSCKSIYGLAFARCMSLSEITSSQFPVVETLDISAFSDCTSLSRIVLNTVTTLVGSFGSTYANMSNVPNLSYIEMNNLSEIPSNAFQFMSSSAGLKSVCFRGIHTIGSRAFAYDSSLESIEFGDSLDTIGGLAFMSTLISSISISHSVHLSSAAFAAMKFLEAAHVPINGNELAMSAFAGCEKLSSVYIGDIDAIGSYGFNGCRILTLSMIRNLSVLQSIGDNAFAQTAVSYIPSNTVSIAKGFASCPNLSRVSQSDFPNATIIGSTAFSECTNLSEVDFVNVVSVGSYAFCNCSSLASLNMPNVTRIESAAFFGCSRLTSCSMSKLQHANMRAFYGCDLSGASFPRLQDVPQSFLGNNRNMSFALLSSVSYIRSAAFSGCFNLVSLYLLGSSVPGLGAPFLYVFSSTPLGDYSVSAGRYGSIYVPMSLLAIYQSAMSWSYFSSRFVGLTDEEIAAISS